MHCVREKKLTKKPSWGFEEFSGFFEEKCLKLFSEIVDCSGSELDYSIAFRASTSLMFDAVATSLMNNGETDIASNPVLSVAGPSKIGLSDMLSRDYYTLLFKRLKEKGGETGSTRKGSVANTDKHTTAILRRVYEEVDENLGDEEVPAEYLGMVFENLYGKVPRTTSRGSYRLHTTGKRRDDGVYFTPPELVRDVSYRTLQPLLSRINTLDDLLRLRILDPAVGAGYFLIEALRLLAYRLLEIQGVPHNDENLIRAKSLIAQNSIYGVDVDPLAVEISTILVCLEVDHSNSIRPILDQHIKVGDSLLGLSLDKVLEYHPLPYHYKAIGYSQKKGREDSIQAKLRQAHSEIVSHHVNPGIVNKDQEGIVFRPFCWEIEFPEVFLDRTGLRSPKGGFDVIISNPPWGKIKQNYKEFFTYLDERVAEYQGVCLRNYITKIDKSRNSGSLQDLWNRYVQRIKSYIALLQKLEFYNAQRLVIDGKTTGGDPDLYKYFMERAFHLVKPTGRIGLVVPASFHHTQGASGIRQLYLKNGVFEVFNSFENRKRFFPIHGMFRFVIFAYQRSNQKGIKNAQFGLTEMPEEKKWEQRSGRRNKKHVNFSLQFLKRVSGSYLTIPEIRNSSEKDILKKLHKIHPPLGKKIKVSWNVSFIREFDMTNDNFAFILSSDLPKVRVSSDGTISSNGEKYFPVFEGRMVNQFDYAAKGYIAGNGRTAQWEPLYIKKNKAIRAHYYMSHKHCGDKQERIFRPRAGFCDITGHANERTVLAALIPGLCVCGNKVPTLEFDSEVLRLHLIWIAVANSFVVDWLVRRRISTTLNFFHWEQIPFPRIDPDTEIGERLAVAAAKLCMIDASSDHMRTWLQCAVGDEALPNDPLPIDERAQVRAEIDAIVADLYDLSPEDFALILSDFPLLDRHQPPINTKGYTVSKKVLSVSESRSTITRDNALNALFELKGVPTPNDIRKIPFIGAEVVFDLAERLVLARKVGAVSYVPAEQAAKRKDFPA